jgi:lysophospholipase L1-like esterase
MTRRAGSLALLLLGVVLGLLAAEAFVRLLTLDPHERSGYAPVNTRRRWGGPMNSRGYRDEERSLARPPGTHRIVALGDSFAWGAGVEFEDAYPQRLERMLRRRRRERWEVVSLARPGMNTVEQAAQLADEGLAYDPDLVLLGYCLNDSEDESAAEPRRARDWEELREERQGRRPVTMLDRSALYRFVSGRVRATTETRRRIANYRSQYRDDYAGWIAGRRALEDMGRRCRERRIPFVVAVFPLFGNPLGDDYPFAGVHASLDRAAAAAGAHVVELLPAYRGLRWELLVVDGVDDEHPNEIAHRIAANVILSALDDVLPAPRAQPQPSSSCRLGREAADRAGSEPP